MRLLCRITAAALLPLLVVFAAACGSDDNGNGSGQEFNDDPTAIQGVSTIPAYPYSVQRTDGETLTFEHPPSRIVSLSPAATEIIYALGAESSLVAVDKQADYPEAAAAFPTKVDAFEPNVEAIAGLNPDLVIVNTNTDGLVGKLDQLNIPTLWIDIDQSITSVDDVMGQVRIYGQITDTTDRSVEIITDMGVRIRAVQDGLQGVNKSNGPKVFHELDSTLFTVSNRSFIGDVYDILATNNIAGDGGGQAYPQMTQEAVIASDPDVIILADEEFGVSIESVKARPGWDAIAAVQNDQIYGIDPDIISRPGPRIVDALEQLAQYIYPSRFG